jgi:hypothetical protein
MISTSLIDLIEVHALPLSREVAQELHTNERTRGFRAVSREDLEQRVFNLLNHLGDWLADPKSERVQAEFTDWGQRRFNQQVPLSEILFAVIILKQHLRRYIQDNGLVDAAFPRVEQDYILPMHMYSLQDLNFTVGRFFDEAFYNLARGYEAAAKRGA